MLGGGSFVSVSKISGQPIAFLLTVDYLAIGKKMSREGKKSSCNVETLTKERSCFHTVFILLSFFSLLNL